MLVQDSALALWTASHTNFTATKSAATETALPFVAFAPRVVTAAMTVVHLMIHLRPTMTSEMTIWKPPSQHRSLKLHLQDLRLPPLLQLQLPPQLLPLQQVRLLNPDVFRMEPYLVVLTSLMAWDLESSHVLARGTISKQLAFITQTWNPSRTRKTLPEPPDRRGVLPRHQVLWCSHRAEEFRKRLRPAKA